MLFSIMIKRQLSVYLTKGIIMINSKGFAAQKAGATLAPFNFQRREVGPHDILIDILYCVNSQSDNFQIHSQSTFLQFQESSSFYCKHYPDIFELLL